MAELKVSAMKRLPPVDGDAQRTVWLRAGGRVAVAGVTAEPVVCLSMA
jgi:hypothetical protein